MNVYTCSDFTGHWPVGTAAVVTAENRYEAATRLEVELERIGLKQKVNFDQMVPFNQEEANVLVLCDGNY